MSILPALILMTCGQSPPNPLRNSDFSDGLAGWKPQGDVRTAGGKLTIGPGAGAVRQRYEVPGLRILYFGATVGSSGRVRLQCFGKGGESLMNLDAGPDAKGSAGIYTKTPANTAYVELSIEKAAFGEGLTIEKVVFQDDDRNRVEHPPQVDINAAMRPIWKADTVQNESVLLLSTDAEPATGLLMFAPAEVIAVKDSSLGKSYREGVDFRVDGRSIVTIPGSPVPTMKRSEFAKGEFPWTDLAGRHVFVTYRHTGGWNGPTPTYQGERLPRTLAKLKSRQPVTLVAYGDSITLGINVSGYRNVPPYLPPWPALVEHQLRRANPKVRVVNAALGGATSQWAKDNARDAVAALAPDLVILAFGMNDFWSLNPAEFRANIEATIATIRTRQPACEFILVASMKFDPAYTTQAPYPTNLSGYADELRRLAGPGVAFVDMTAISDALYNLKSAKDLGTDPMHPDDFLARWYAQAVVQTLVRDP